MGRLERRSGNAQLMTATQLSTKLAVPLLLIVEGYALPSFPSTDRAAPSSGVFVVPSKPDPMFRRVGLPIGVHWQQWNTVAVPVLQNVQTSGWRGKSVSLGDTLNLLLSIVGPDGTVYLEEGTTIGTSLLSSEGRGRLYACDPPQMRGKDQSKTYRYLVELTGLIYRTAISAGYL